MTAVELRLRGSPLANSRRPEVRAPEGRPACPRWLRKDARAMWKHLVPLLERMGVLTLADGNCLARYCEFWARWRAASEFVAKNGEGYPIKDKNDKVIGFKKFPHTVVARQLGAELLRLELQLGLTPAARVGLPREPGRGDKRRERFFHKPRLAGSNPA